MYKYEKEIHDAWKNRTEWFFDCPSFIEDGFFKYGINAFRGHLSQNARRAFDRYYILTKDGPVRGTPTVQTIEEYKVMPPTIFEASPYIDTDEHFQGLYFIGMVGYNPVTLEKSYLVKIGKSSDIGNRMKQYMSMNPMLYHNHCSLGVPRTGTLNNYERNCHAFLAENCIKRPTGSSEWFYVTEENYMKFCDKFFDPDYFEIIARGEW